MPCYRPLEGFRSAKVNASGKRGITFKRSEAFVDQPVVIPCGRCVGCRLERSRQWAVRCVGEAQLYEDNCYLTLTYSDKYLPENRSVDVGEMQRFMKRLRKKYGVGIRFYLCGEYGEENGRPHYHVLLFNHDFEDKVFLKTTKSGDRLYRSAELEELWPFGMSSVGSVTFESAAYVARYVMKKVMGDGAEEHYEYIHPETGEVFQRRAEFTTMSRRPGIGSEWFSRYKDDIYPHDFVVVRGRKLRPPKYYDRLFEDFDPAGFAAVKRARKESGESRASEQTTSRLIVREKVARKRVELLKRGIDDEA